MLTAMEQTGQTLPAPAQRHAAAEAVAAASQWHADAAVDDSPRMATQRAQVAAIQDSPRMTAQQQGLPDSLKAGIESLSGMSMDHVKVHYNSSQPAQLQALAYAQGSDIHLAPG